MASSFSEFRDELNAMKPKRRGKGRPPKEEGEAEVQAAQEGLKEAPRPLTVSQLTAQIERVIKAGFPSSILVQGEVSNLKIHSSGHIYFTLKDSEACINCVMFRSDAGRLKFEPEDGMELLVSGRVSVYAQRIVSFT